MARANLERGAKVSPCNDKVVSDHTGPAWMTCASANDPRFERLRQDLECGWLNAGTRRSVPIVVVVGTVGKEEALAEIVVEDGLAIGELCNDTGVRVRDLSPRLPTGIARRETTWNRCCQ